MVQPRQTRLAPMRASLSPGDDIMQVTDLKPLYGEDKLDALQLNVARFNAGNQNGQPKKKRQKKEDIWEEKIADILANLNLEEFADDSEGD